MSRSGHNSIDAFLETVPEQADLGKYLIAREIKRHEDIDGLFPPHNSGWYRYLFNRLLRSDGGSDFAGSRLAIITFNYDRSLEAYLHEALKARFELNHAEAQGVLLQIPIVHVHGVMGRYPDVPYTPECEPNDLIEISTQIKIIHEVKDQAEGFCSPEFEQAHALLREAQRIFFLGFGFHPDNIRRLSFFTPENTKGRDFFASSFGMGTVEVEELASRLEPLGIPKKALNGNQCNNFFSHFSALH